MTALPAAPQGRPVGASSPGRRWRWPVAAATLLVLTTGMVSPLARRTETVIGSEAALAALRDAGERRFAGRLSGFRHAVMRAGGATPGPLSARNAALVTAAAAAQRAALADPSPRRLHAWGLSQLLLGDYHGAVSSLRAAADQAETNAGYFSDLTAALLARAQALDQPEDLPLALEAAERARALGDGPEIRYNRALALEALGLGNLALKDWEALVNSDPSRGWADEAQQRLLALRDSAAITAWTPRDPITVRNAFRARQWLRREGLSQWANAILSDRSPDAALTRVVHVSSALATATADREPRVIATEVTTFSGDRLRHLAVAHRAMAMSVLATDADRIGDVRQHTAQACAAFRLAQSELQSTCEIEQAFFHVEQRNFDGARSEANRLTEKFQQQGFNAALGRARWLIVYVSMLTGRLAEAGAAAAEARMVMERTGSWPDAVRMQNDEASMAWALGHYETGWRMRRIAAARASEINDPRLNFIIAASLATHFLNEGFSRAALTLARSALDEARSPTMRVHPLQHILMASVRIGRLEDARSSADELSAIFAQSGDARLPALSVDAQRAMAHLADAEGDPHAALELLSTTLSHVSSDRELSIGLWARVDRAALQVALGNVDAAAQDIDRALMLIERRTGRESVALRLTELVRLRETAATVALSESVERWSALRLIDRASTLDAGIAVPQDQAVALSAIPINAAIVVYGESSDRVAAWVLRANQFSFSMLSTTPADLRRLAHETRTLATFSKGGDHRWIETLSELDLRLMEPLARDLEGCDDVIIVARGQAAAVAFDVLPSLSDRTVTRAVSVAHALTPRTRIDLSHVLIVSDTLTTTAGALPGARAEAGAVAAAHAASTVTVISGAAAHKREVESRMASAGVVHFAIHAVAHPEFPSRSFLQLAGSGGDDDGRWRISDMQTGLFGRQQTIVLAACDTAAGAAGGPDAVSNLADAFLRAGAGAVVASLWPLSDAVVGDFFALLHQELRRHDSAAAALAVTRRSFMSQWPDLKIQVAGIQAFTGAFTQRGHP